MNKLYVVCVVTLLAILLDVLLFHSRTSSAQYTNYTVQPVPIDKPFDLHNGTVVGFSCIAVQQSTQCYAMKRP